MALPSPIAMLLRQMPQLFCTPTQVKFNLIAHIFSPFLKNYTKGNCFIEKRTLLDLNHKRRGRILQRRKTSVHRYNKNTTYFGQNSKVTMKNDTNYLLQNVTIVKGAIKVCNYALTAKTITK